MTIATIIITAILSALHGWGKIAKIYATIAMCLYCTAALYLCGAGWYSLVGLVIGYLWRIVTRSGRQAHAELAAMDTVHYYYTTWEKVRDVGFAHWCNPLGFVLGFIIAKWLNYKAIPYRNDKFFDTRRYVEIASGALPQAAFVILLMEAVKICL